MSNPLLEQAKQPLSRIERVRQYIGRGWAVLPLHSIRQGRCSCGKICKSPGKHPRTKHGFHDACTDSATAEGWWRKWPDANIGIATGKSGLVVVDVDGPEGQAQLKAIVARHGNGTVLRTLAVSTGRPGGYHLYYAGTGVPSSQDTGTNVDVRGTTGYVLAPGSNHLSGKDYEWVEVLDPVQPAPAWVSLYVAEGSLAAAPAGSGTGTQASPLPAWITPDSSLSGRLAAALTEPPIPWNEHEEARLRSALASIPPSTGGKVWASYLGALHDLRWIISGVDRGQLLAVEWSRLSQGREGGKGQYREGEIEGTRWPGFAKSNKTVKTTVASIYKDATARGWVYSVPAIQPPPEVEKHNEANGVYALPAALTQQTSAIHFIDLDKGGRPKATCVNSRVAIAKLGVTCRHDVFHNKMLVGGEPIAQWAGELTDPAVHMLRCMIHTAFGFDPGKEATRDASEQLCLQNQFDPVLDYFDGLAWDGRPRLGRWLTDYMGADASTFTADAGGLLLVAAVRRARRPGCKFDQIMVLEGKEGTGKSSALVLLAGEDNFSDQSILGRSEREQQEAAQGVLVYEIPELTGMRRTEQEQIKAFASRTHDRARPAYGHFRQDVPRRCVYVATTNEETYLKSETGDRRFWPVRTGQIKLDALARDRDQLWAEAAYHEEQGVKLTLRPELYGAARAEQIARLDVDPWFGAIKKYVDKDNLSVWETSTTDILSDAMHFQTKDMDRASQTRVGYVMKKLGFDKYRRRDGHELEWRFRRSSNGSGGNPVSG